MQRVSSLVRGMRLLAREDAQRSDPVDLARALQTAIGVASVNLPRGARVLATYEAAPAVRVDEGSLVQVFIDVLLHAASAIPAGVPESRQVRVRLYTEEGSAVVAIRSAIPETGSSRGTIPFFFGGSPSATLGLALSICDRVSTGLGGGIAIESRTGSGTTVRITLPTCSPWQAVVRPE